MSRVRPRWPDGWPSLFLLPIAVVVAFGLAYGPELWHSHYGTIKEFCAAYLKSPSIIALLAPVAAGVGVIGLCGGLWRLLRHVHADLSLEKAMRSRARPTPPPLKRAARQAGVADITVCMEEDAPIAFCRGLLRHRIYLSTGLIELLDDGELGAVLVHEAAHASRRDPLRALLVKVFFGSLFFVPLARELEQRCLLSLELVADRRAVDFVSLPLLASALLKILAARTPYDPKITVPAFNPTEERIRRLTEGSGGRWKGFVGVMARPLAWTTGSGVIAVTVLVLGLPVVLSLSGCMRPPS